MNDFQAPNMVTRSEKIEDTAKTLHEVSLQIAELQRIKEELDKQLNALLEHTDDGQKTYTYGKWKITVKSGYNYSLNIDEYETIGHFLPRGFDPVLKKVKYEINKNAIRACAEYGSAEQQALLTQMVSKKPSKLNVKISAGVV